MDIEKGTILFDRYVVTDRLGRGGYGFVFKAIDSYDETEVAVKISLGSDHTYIRNMCEGEILHMLSENESPYSHLVVHMKTWFYEQDCVILILELLSHDLRHAIRYNMLDNSLSTIAHYGKQMMEFLCYMSRLEIIHGDIKPENILVQAGPERRIKFNDFGLAYWPRVGFKPKKIQTLVYRAPEVLLGYDYGKEVDIWGVGCVLMELLLGFILFNVEDELELMMLIVEIVGMPPEEYIENAPNRDEYFIYDKKYKQWLVHGFASPVKPVGLNNFLKKNCNINCESAECEAFVDLVEGMLQFSPEKRMSAEECLRHSFFQQ